MREKKMLPVLGQETADEASNPAVREGSATSATLDGVERTIVRVEGMDCASCATTVERRVAALPGVRGAVVNFAVGRLDAEHDPSISTEEIEAAIEAAGYGVSRAENVEGPPFWRTPQALLTAASAVLFVVGLALSVAGVPGLVTTMIYAAAIVIGGLPIFRAALAGLTARHLDMNVLMSVAVIGAAILGEWAEAASVVVLFAAGNALQIYAVDRTRGAVRSLIRLAPDEVLVKRAGTETIVPADDVGVGEVMVVRPGERLAVDGEVVEGASAVDESPITGESVPVEKGPGEAVFSGTLNGSGGMLVQATKKAGDSTLQKIARLIEEAQARKAPAELFVDRFSRVYTPIVVTAAIVLAIVPAFVLGASFGEWFYRALALLIIACPCALVISTPVTVVSGIGAASRRGILVKSGAALESAGRLRALAFDKTGTLTEGRPVVSRLVRPDGAPEGEVMRLAAALERRSEHPLAHAILTAAESHGVDSGENFDTPSVVNFRSVAGRGAEGDVAGRRYLIGSPRLFAERAISLTNAREALQEVERAGETPVVLGHEKGAMAVFGISDAPRPEAGATMDALRKMGIRELVMLTGDAEAPARRIARDLGIGYRARLLPEQKTAAVRAMLEEYGDVGMVGDGINDAPALAASSVGLAMGAAGTDVALETADIALMRDDLPKLVEAIRISRSAERIIRQNVVFSILVKGIFVLLAPFGLVTLWLAVLADMGTSIAVTLNGLRLFQRGHRQGHH